MKIIIIKNFLIIIIIILLLSFSVAAKNDIILTSFNFQDYCKKSQNNPSIDLQIINRNVNNINNYFTENIGQLENDEIRFHAQGGDVWFTDSGVWIELREYDNTRDQGSQLRDQRGIGGIGVDPMEIMEPEEVRYKRVVLKQEFVEANPIKPIGKEQLNWKSNFFYGNDPKKWCTEVPNYQEIYYRNILDGIDIKYYWSCNGLKYDIIVHPGADANQIKIEYQGAEKVSKDENGNIVICTQLGNIIDNAPFIYQMIDSELIPIKGQFILYEEFEYGFKILDGYDRNEPLVIDPVVNLQFSTYLGGSNYDDGTDIAVDSSGNSYITGYIASSDFPYTPGANDTSFNGGFKDIFITKFNPTGSSLIYSSYIGGDDSDYGYGIEINANGNAFITGKTRSTNFPTTSGANDTTHNSNYDSFILKMNPAGSTIIYSTYIGGGSNDEGRRIAIDNSGNAYVTGITYSSNFPNTTGAQDNFYNTGGDAFLSKLNPNGANLLYSSYIGGDNKDEGRDITLDSTGIYLTGYTSSSNFPVKPGSYDTSHNGNSDCFVLKFNSALTNLVFSTFIGGSNEDEGYGIKVDPMGAPVVTGKTRSSNFPTVNAYDGTLDGIRDIFIVRLNKTGSKLNYSTYIGGSSNDEGYDLDVDSSGNIYITGYTGSVNFPTTPDAYDLFCNGTEAFISKLASNGTTILYSSYFGGTSNDNGRGIALDSINSAYITGTTISSDFPYTMNAYNKTFGGNSDVFVSKFYFTPILNITSFSLLEDNAPVDLLYSKLKPYTFRINITDTASISDIKNVQLIVDPLSTNINLNWDGTSDKFSKSNDPNNYLELTTASCKSNISLEKCKIEFNFIINWDYPNEDVNDVHLCVASNLLSQKWLNQSNVFQVENDLVFDGTLKVRGTNDRKIEDNDLVGGGEQIIWTGLKTVYEGTLDIYPPDEEYNINIWNEEGNYWSCSPAPGEELNIMTVCSNKTNIEGDTHRINISNIPPGCDKTDMTFTLRIDGDNVTFSNEYPKNSTWQNTTNVLVGVRIADSGGGIVNGSTIKYSISTDNGTRWSEWEPILETSSAIIIDAEETIILEDGTDNLIRWCATDSTGNGPEISNSYRVLIDTNEIIFSDPWPSNNEISKLDNVEFGITITDSISGVNSSTIEYAVSDDKGKTWSTWYSIDGHDDGLKMQIKTNYTFLNGTDNRIKWRASDLAGNGPTESNIYTIKVNTWVPEKKPEVILVSPLLDMIINATEIELNWKLRNTTMIGVIYDVYFDDISPPELFVQNLTNTSYFIKDLDENETYYWFVIPKFNGTKGTCLDGTWRFMIASLPPEQIYKLSISGRESITLKPGENISIIFIITNLGSSVDSIRLELAAGKLSKNLYLEDDSVMKLGSLNYGQKKLTIILPETTEIGIYNITLTAISINSEETVSESHILSIIVKSSEKPPPNGKEPNGKEPNGNNSNVSGDKPKTEINYFMISVIAIVIALIIILSIFAITKKRKKRLDKELVAGTGMTIKPSAHPTVRITQDQITTEKEYASIPVASSFGLPQSTNGRSKEAPHVDKEQMIQSSDAQKIADIPRLPRLPPAQEQHSDPDLNQSSTVYNAQPTLARQSQPQQKPALEYKIEKD